jgi:N6-adenosine-specific RNA methylase IME4
MARRHGARGAPLSAASPPAIEHLAGPLERNHRFPSGEAPARAERETHALPSKAVAEWAGRIVAAWRKSVDGILEAGRLLAEAKAVLPHGAFVDMVERELPFGARMAQMLMKIGADPRLADAKHASLLPTHWYTLYELTKLSDQAFAVKLSTGEIHPGMERRDVVMADIRERRTKREAELGAKQLADPEGRYGVVNADPPWRWEAWSRETGLDHAAESHYATMTVDQVIALKNFIAKIADDDCVHFMWTTRPHLMNAGAVMTAWGFAYKTCFGWEKTNADGSSYHGNGYWARDNLELLLVGTRGSIPAPAPGAQWPALIKAPVGRGPDGRIIHSRKPAIFYDLIESYFPTLPKIELFCRGAPRPGWAAWGNEALGEAALLTESPLLPKLPLTSLTAWRSMP